MYAFGDHIRRYHSATVVELGIPLCGECRKNAYQCSRGTVRIFGSLNAIPLADLLGEVPHKLIPRTKILHRKRTAAANFNGLQGCQVDGCIRQKTCRLTAANFVLYKT